MSHAATTAEPGTGAVPVAYVLVSRWRTFWRDVRDFLSGQPRLTFYYAAVSVWEATIAIGWAAASLLRIPVAGGACERLVGFAREYFGSPAVYLYGSARSGLCNHLRALGLQTGSEVILTGFTCEAVPNAVIQAGLTPVYADIDAQTFCMSPGSVRSCITARTRVLIVQHTYGIAAELDALLEIARLHGLYVIEDCAVSLGSRSEAGRLTGTYGDAAIFSFEVSKIITSCRGGMVVINNDRWNARTRHRELYGMVRAATSLSRASVLFQLGVSTLLHRPRVHAIGRYIESALFKLRIFRPSTSRAELHAGLPADYFHRLSDPQAAILLRQWRRLPAIHTHAKTIVGYYQGRLGPGSQYGRSQGHTTYFMRYPVLTSQRGALRDCLENMGIELGMWFTAPLSSTAIDHKRFGYEWGDCPVAEQVALRICNLPTNPKVNRQLAERIATAFLAVEESVTTLTSTV